MTILLLCCYGWLSAQNYHVGDLYTAPDGSQGIVFYVQPDGINGWVVALEDASEGCQWGTSSDVPGLPNQDYYYLANSLQNLLNDTSGYANTQIIRNYQNNSSYAAGVVGFAHGWHLPSPAQLAMLYAQLPFVSAALVNAGGTDLANAYYWTSAEYSSSRAWAIDFGEGESGYGNYGSGNFGNFAKTTSYHVRAVCCFTNTPPVFDTTLSYVWSTGDTTATITVASEETTHYTVTVTTSGGCVDSVSKTVVIRHGDTMYVTQAACESFVWNGVAYTESGIYTQLFDSEVDCDSAVTLVLTITESPDVSVTMTADTLCEGDSVTLQAVSTPVAIVPVVAVGDILCTDGTTVKPAAFAASGKTAQGVVFYVDTTGAHGWAVHLHDQSEQVRWSTIMVDVPGVSNFLTFYDPGVFPDFAGYANTQALWAAGDSATYPAAHTVDFPNGWYLPDVGQLDVLFSELTVLNPSLQMAGGTSFPTDAVWFYWSSTESASYNPNFAWFVCSNGLVDYWAKTSAHYNYHLNPYEDMPEGNLRVRSIRNF